MTRNPPTSYRLTPKARELLRWLSEQMGISMSGVLELLIRDRARREKR